MTTCFFRMDSRNSNGESVKCRLKISTQQSVLIKVTTDIIFKISCLFADKNKISPTE